MIFFIGVPAFFALIFKLPFYRHLPLNIATIVFSAAGALELSVILEKKHIHISKTEAVILGSLAPIAATLQVSFNFPQWIIPLFIMAGASWAILSQAFTRSKNMENVINNVAGCFSALIYPAFFVLWIVKMSIWENSGAVFLFFLVVFMNDSTAWLTGTLFGKNNSGIIAASPNKSIAGFIGGFIASITVCAGAAWLFPFVFFSGENNFSALLAPAVVLGLVTGIFATLGDLAESAVKRSCDIKNSGRLMLERGGILDSVDSISAAAPVFYILYNVLFYNA
jgi:phosphatidate cytidylyltransferase